ncbi:MAG: NTP transferase domain-containing protein [Dehalococcoidia bacterium]
MTVAAILLAAGESTRMGSPKPLLPWGGGTLVQYQLEQLRASRIDHIIVVLGHQADKVRPHIAKAGVEVVENPDYRQGRATSLRAGVAHLPPDTEAIVVLNVDQPRPHGLIDALVEAHLSGGHLITVPSYQGRRGHPPVLSGALIPELHAISDERQGLREVMQRHAADVRELPWGSDIVLLDINTPEEYQRARESYSL